MGIGDWGLGIGPNPQSPIVFYILLNQCIYLYNIKNQNITLLKNILKLKNV